MCILKTQVQDMYKKDLYIWLKQQIPAAGAEKNSSKMAKFAITN